MARYSLFVLKVPLNPKQTNILGLVAPSFLRPFMLPISKRIPLSGGVKYMGMGKDAIFD